MAQLNYWKECISNGAEECNLTLTKEQLETLAEFAMSGHEYYDMAFYSPPWTDRFDDIKNEWEKKLKDKEDELNEYRQNAEMAVKIALNQHSDTHISIGKHGEVIKYCGQSYQIQ